MISPQELRPILAPVLEQALRNAAEAWSVADTDRAARWCAMAWGIADAAREALRGQHRLEGA